MCMGLKNFEKPDNTENVEKAEKNDKPKEKENILNKVKDFFAEHGKNKGKEASQEKPRNQILEIPSEKKSDGPAGNKQDGKEEKQDKAAEFRASLKVEGIKNPTEIKARPKGGVERQRGVSDDPRREDADDDKVNTEKEKSSDDVKE